MYRNDDLMKVRKPKPDVYAVLKNYGAPFWDQPDASLSLEEAIVLGLKYSPKSGHALIAGIIPYVLTINSEQLNTELLLRKLESEQQRQLLGYFADFANQFKPSRKLKALSDELYDPNYEKFKLVSGRLTKLMKLVIESRHNPTAKKWNILTIDELEGHFIRYRKWLFIQEK